MAGFSQLGAESDWRSANTESMRAAFTEENGYKLVFDNGQQKQANQIRAIRTFIQQEVDYIVLAPVTETGWDTVLQEAKDAKIPVIIVDRMVDVEDSGLFTYWVGSNFELEGKKAAEWLRQYTEAKGLAPEDVHIVNIQGTIGASAQIGRSKGLTEAANSYGWDLMAEAPGDFTQAKGREVMEAFLEQYDNINVVYCENDNETFGAIEAIESAGRKAGSDIARGEIMVISFDGVDEDAIRYLTEGKITCIVECNPLHGPVSRRSLRRWRRAGSRKSFPMWTEKFSAPMRRWAGSSWREPSTMSRYWRGRRLPELRDAGTRRFSFRIRRSIESRRPGAPGKPGQNGTRCLPGYARRCLR